MKKFSTCQLKICRFSYTDYFYLTSSEKGEGNGPLQYPTPVLLSGKSHGWRSLVGCSPWGHKESNMTEWLHFHFSFSCIGEGSGNPLQCSCLENPRDGGAWQAAVYGVAQSWTWLKWLSSSSNYLTVIYICVHQVKDVLTLTLHGNSNIYIDSQFAKKWKGNIIIY